MTIPGAGARSVATIDLLVAADPLGACRWRDTGAAARVSQ